MYERRKGWGVCCQLHQAASDYLWYSPLRDTTFPAATGFKPAYRPTNGRQIQYWLNGVLGGIRTHIKSFAGSCDSHFTTRTNL